MNDAALTLALRGQLRESFNRPGLDYNPGTMMRDILGFDSVQFIMMILALETAFEIQLHEDEVDSIYSMGDIFRVLRDKVAADG